MTTFYTSDPRFGDGAAAKRRGYNSVEEAKALFKAAWDATVGENDEVYILGNFSQEKPRLVKEFLLSLKRPEDIFLQRAELEYDPRFGISAKDHTSGFVTGGRIKFIYTLATNQFLCPNFGLLNPEPCRSWVGPAREKNSVMGFTVYDPIAFRLYNRAWRHSVVKKVCHDDEALAKTIKHALIYGGEPGIDGRHLAAYGMTDEGDYFFNVSGDFRGQWGNGPVPNTVLFEHCCAMANFNKDTWRAKLLKLSA